MRTATRFNIIKKEQHKMKSNTKRILGLILALVLAFSAFGGMALAVGDGGLIGSAIPPDPSNPDCSTYEITKPTPTSSINVAFVIEAGDEIFGGGSKFRVEIPSVILTSGSAQLFTVTDLLVYLNGRRSTYNLTFLDPNRVPLTSTSSYLGIVDYGSDEWEAGQLGFDGWVFRVNDKFPVYLSGSDWFGADILQTNIKDGDVVHFFYDFPSDYDRQSGSFAADNVRAIQVSSTRTSLTVQLQGHDTYIHPTSPYDFEVNNYANLQDNIVASVVDDTGTTITGTSNVNGQVTFNGSFTSGQIYIVTTESQYYPPYGFIGSDVYFSLTGAYSKVEA
jgi:hypothetical protein